MGKTILSSDQKRLLAQFIEYSEVTDHFYLTGGTALAEFYFHHRLSEDFDFFSSDTLDESMLISVVQKISNTLKIKDTELKKLRGQLTFFFHFPANVIKVDFAYYPFDVLGDFISHKTLRIASLLDISVNKLQAIQTRQRGRDFVDLYYILHGGKVTVDELLSGYRNKFDLHISTLELAKYFSQVVDAIDQPRFLGKNIWEDVEQYFLDQSKLLVDKHIK